VLGGSIDFFFAAIPNEYWMKKCLNLYSMLEIFLDCSICFCCSRSIFSLLLQVLHAILFSLSSHFKKKSTQKFVDNEQILRKIIPSNVASLHCRQLLCTQKKQQMLFFQNAWRWNSEVHTSKRKKNLHQATIL
jgi:hypothetical protein